MNGFLGFISIEDEGYMNYAHKYRGLIAIHLKLILDMVLQFRVSDLFCTEFSVASLHPHQSCNFNEPNLANLMKADGSHRKNRYRKKKTDRITIAVLKAVPSSLTDNITMYVHGADPILEDQTACKQLGVST